MCPSRSSFAAPAFLYYSTLGRGEVFGNQANISTFASLRDVVAWSTIALLYRVTHKQDIGISNIVNEPDYDQGILELNGALDDIVITDQRL